MLEGPNDHVIAKRDFPIPAGASRTISFRGTPGGRLEIRAGAVKGPGGTGSTSDLPSVGPANDAVFVSRPLVGGPFAPPESVETESALLGRLGPNSTRGGTTTLAARRPRFTTVGVGGTVIIDEPDLPPDLPEPPRPPVDLTVKVRGGPTLHSEPGMTAKFPFLARAVIPPLPSHAIVDVTFRNPNDFGVQLLAFLQVQNELEVQTTRVPRLLLERVFDDTLHFLAPTISANNGKLTIALQPEAQGFVPPVTVDLGRDFDAGMTLRAVDFELIDYEAAVRRVVPKLHREVLAMRSPDPNRPFPTVPDDFVGRTIEAFFADTATLPHLFSEGMGLLDIQWKKQLARYPILSKQTQFDPIERDDVALCFKVQVEELVAGDNRLEIEVDTIDAELIMVLRSGNAPISEEEHPAHQDVPDDFMRAGTLRPRFDFSIDFGGIEVELDLGTSLGVLEPLVWLAENAAEEAAEALIEWLKDDAADEIRGIVLGYLDDHRAQIGELATQVMGLVSNRDHVFRSLRHDRRGWMIESVDPAQLAVPFVEPDPIDHRFDNIDIVVPAEDPIDGPMPADATQRLGRVEHLVFLMMENRSFDHMLGYLSHPEHGGRGDVNGHDGRSVRLGGDFGGVFHVPQPGARLVFPPSPGHDFDTVARQIAEGAMDGFATEFGRRLERAPEINPRGNFNDPTRIHKFYTGRQLPTYDGLAASDTVLDHWFSSVPGPTYPNRHCYYVGDTPALKNTELFEDAGYQQGITIFDLMDREGVEWTLFESDVSFLRMFEKYRLETDKIQPIIDLLNPLDVSELPPVTFIDPNFKGAPSKDPANDDHGPTDVFRGQCLIADIVAALQRRRSWDKTMLVITYDEHGGFADHVPPPGTAASGIESIPRIHPEASTYGVRVPAIVVSPLVAAGGVGNKIYDHATPFRTIVERFMPQHRNSSILPERVRRSRHLGEIVMPTGTNMAERPPQIDAEEHEEPDALVEGPGSAVRPSFEVEDPEDFHYGLRRLGNPTPPRGG